MEQKNQQNTSSTEAEVLAGEGAVEAPKSAREELAEEYGALVGELKVLMRAKVGGKTTTFTKKDRFKQAYLSHAELMDALECFILAPIALEEGGMQKYLQSQAQVEFFMKMIKLHDVKMLLIEGMNEELFKQRSEEISVSDDQGATGDSSSDEGTNNPV